MTTSKMLDALRNGSPFSATTVVKGVVEKATTAEAKAGTIYKFIDAALLHEINGGLLTKVIDIEEWDMNATIGVNIAHGVNFNNIRSVSALIRNDGNSLLHPLIGEDTTGIKFGYFMINGSNVALYRTPGGQFNNTNYDMTSYNRGWIIIQYTP